MQTRVCLWLGGKSGEHHPETLLSWNLYQNTYLCVKNSRALGFLQRASQRGRSLDTKSDPFYVAFSRTTTGTEIIALHLEDGHD